MYASIARRAAALLILCGLASPAWAGINEWTRISPDQPVRTVYDLTYVPSRPETIYAGLETGLYRSTDAGQTWVYSGHGLEGRWGANLIFDPASPETLYAEAGDSIFKSLDGGRRWFRLPGFRRDLLGASRGKVYALDDQRLYQSSDGGQTWVLVNDSVSVYWTFAVDPGRSDTLYAGAGSQGILKSVDGGRTWLPANQGLPSSLSSPLFVFDPRSPQTLFIAAFHSGPRIFRSTNGGATWQPASQGLGTANILSIALDPLRRSTLYVATDQGVFKSTDNGASWSAANEGLPTAPTLILATSSAVIAGTLQAGLFRSADRGASWSPANQGLQEGAFHIVGIGRGEPSVLYTFNDNDLIRTRDGGRSWTLLSDTWGGNLVTDPASPSTLYATVPGWSKSTDHGAHWSSLNVPGPWLEIDPRHPAVLYSGTRRSGAWGRPLPGCGLWKSPDSGATWTCLLEFPDSRWITSLAIDPLDTSILYATDDFSELYRSADGGSTWTWLLWSSLPPAIDPLDPSNVYLPAGRRVARSVDRGLTWETFPLGLPRNAVAVDIEIDPVSPSTLYVATREHGVLKSTDSGETWTRLGRAMVEERLIVEDLAIDPVDTSVLYAATIGGGIRKLTQRQPGTCVADATTLCLRGRFEVKVAWRDFEGRRGPGHARTVSGETGAFWFSGDDSVDLVVKALDGRDTNGHFWVFSGALTNIEYTLVVTDTVTGVVRGYFNLPGRFTSRGDTQAFRDRVLPGPQPPTGGSLPASPCGDALCLGENSRFRVTVAWKDFAGNTGKGHASPLTGGSGLFWFFQPGNVELAVKILDGRGTNGHFWFFYGALSSVEYTLTVTDTVTGKVKTYVNPSGRMASVGDMEAF